MAKKFLMELDENQADTVKRALDLYSRVGAGQVEEVMKLYQWEGRIDDGVNLDCLHQSMADVKRDLTGFPMNASHSIGSDKVPVGYRRAYDILQVLRQVVAKAQDTPPTHSVDMYDPLPCTEEELPKVSLLTPGK